nr:MAG TPA: hypothetical protein [Caudoviricetes sp.]
MRSCFCPPVCLCFLAWLYYSIAGLSCQHFFLRSANFFY